MTRSSVAVGMVGAGRVGSVLAAKLRAAGHPIVGVSGRSPASQLRIQTLLPDVDVLAPADIAARADVLLLAVPDDALIRVAEELAPACVRARSCCTPAAGTAPTPSPRSRAWAPAPSPSIRP